MTCFKQLSSALTAALAAYCLLGTLPTASVNLSAASRSGTGGLFRVSDTGSIGNASFVASHPAISYNSARQQYLIVWQGNETGQYQIYGQLVDARSWTEVGPDDFQISSMRRGARTPAVSYDVERDEYLVVWNGDDYPVHSAWQIYGQRFTASGNPVGVTFLIDGGPTEPYSYYCRHQANWCSAIPSDHKFEEPFSSYVGPAGEHFVTYHRADPYGGDGDYMMEFIRVKRIDDGVVGTFDVTYSMPDRYRCCSLASPSFALNSATGQYLTTWLYRPSAGFNVYARPHTTSVTPLYWNGGPVSETTSSPRSPRVVYNPGTNEFLVVWNGIQITYPQVFGQRLSAGGQQLTPNDFQISTNNRPSGEWPTPFYDPLTHEYLVFWNGAQVSWNRAVLAQRLSPAGTAIGAPNFAVTRDGEEVSGRPAIAFSHERREHVIAFSANASPLGLNEYEIFVRRYVPLQPMLVGRGRPGAGELQAWANRTPSGITQLEGLTVPWPEYNERSGELHPAFGDIDGDGLDEVVVGLGEQGQGWMAIFDDAAHDFAFIRWLQLPWDDYNLANGMIWPALGDLDGDGVDEIVAGLGRGGHGYFAVFDDATTSFAFRHWRRVSWSDYSNSQTGDTRPAVLNLDEDRNEELVIGLGPGGSGWVEMFDDLIAGIPYAGWLRVGWGDYASGPGETRPAAGDLDGDGRSELVLGLGPGSDGWLEVFTRVPSGLTHQSWVKVLWSEYSTANGETYPTIGDVDGDPAHELLLGFGAYPAESAYVEVHDDANNGYRHLQWLLVSGDSSATFPAAR